MTTEQRIAVLESENQTLRAELTDKEALLAQIQAEGMGLFLALSSLAEEMVILGESSEGPDAVQAA